jgi:toxin ParE1/3/4
MRLIVTQDALNDLAEIGRYSEREWGRAPKQAYLKAFRDRMTSLLSRPGLGRLRYDLDGRIRSLRSGRHLIFYDLVGEDIVVERVLHERMDIASRFGRNKP